MCDCAPGTQVLAKPSTSCGSYEGRPLSSAMGDHILRILDYKVCLAQVNDRLNHKGAKVKLPNIRAVEMRFYCFFFIF